MSRSPGCTTCPSPARSVRAEPPTRRAAATFVALALSLALALLAGCERGVELDPPRGADSGTDSSTGRGAGSVEDGATALVAQLQAALRDRDEDSLLALGTPAAAGALASTARNLALLDVRRIALRYVATDAPIGDAERAELGDDVVAVRVRLRFAYAGVDERPAEVESRVLLAPTDDGPRIAGLGGVSTATPGAGAGAEEGTGTRTPLWLGTELSVVRRGPTLLAVAGDDPGRYPRLVDRALAQVREVLPQWDGPLVVEVPADREELDAVLGAPAGRFDAIAGVATTVDGSTAPGSPVRVYINPPVFGSLSGQGAQVVLTHEATHVATGAPYADMPVWLLEGFADYVALAGDRVPVDVAARQVLQRVREQGPPDGLPTSADLDPSAPGLGATYEEAWLACRYIGERFGRQALVALYDAVDGGTPTGRAFEEVLGASEADVVSGWQRDVAGLAGVAG